MRPVATDHAPAATDRAQDAPASDPAAGEHRRTERSERGGPSPLTREIAAVATLIGLALLVALNRAVHDTWLGRHDILAQWLPWNTLLGDLLRSFQLPGWNPYMFSGAPFAGDAQSGWMYFPTMVPFTLVADPMSAFKLKVALDLVFAVVSMYALARTLGIRRIGGMTAAVVFAFGPLSYHETHCCTVRSLVALWIPAAFLGVEIAARASSWQVRVFGISVSAFAVSQMLAGFPGQGALDASILLSGWIAYRCLLAPPGGRPGLVSRLRLTALTGVGVFSVAVLLNLAALWPRLEVYLRSTLHTGAYEGDLGYTVGPYDLPGLLRRLIVDSRENRDVAIAGGAIVLALMAPFLCRTRFGVPFFAGMTVVVLALTQPDTPFHAVLNLVPMWQGWHEHNVPIVLSVLMVGPAVLAGAAVDRLWAIRGRLRNAPVVFLPMILVLAAYAWCASRGIEVTPTPIVAAAIVTGLAWLLVDGHWRLRVPHAPRLARLIPAAILLVVFLQPMGMELIDGARGQSSLIRGWQDQYTPEPRVADAADVYTTTAGPGGSGRFLLDRQAAGEDFRYASYVATGVADGANPNRRGTLVQRRYDPHTQALQANGRSVYLRLHETQGYNPVQLTRYADLLTALNGAPQDYHFADLYPPLGNPGLLDVMNIGYLLVDNSLPPGREDVVSLTRGLERVYADEWVTIYDNPDNLGAAWVTYDTLPTPREAAQNRIAQMGFEPGRVALVEGDGAPDLSPPAGATTSSVGVTAREPSRVTYRATSSHDGFMVMSEVYDPGWRAFVDGDEVEIYPTDVALRGIELPAGEHTVELRYEPLSLRLGTAVSAVAHLALIGMLAFAAWTGLRRRRPIRSRRLAA